MGCVNPKQKQKRTVVRRESRYPQEQPSINDDHHFCSVATYNQVTQKACGYNFGEKSLESSIMKRLSTHQNLINQRDIDQITNLIENCNLNFVNHDIDTANDYVNKIENLYQKCDNPHTRSEIEILLNKNSSLLNQVKQQYNDVITYEREILKGGWVQKSNRKGVKVSTRREQSSVGVLVQSIIQEPFEVLITFCIQMDLYKQFMPFMEISRQQKIVARNCRLGYTQNHLPLLSIREAYFQGIGYNRLKKNNTLFLFTRSIHDRPDLQQKFGYKCKINPNNVQLQYKYFVVTYQPISKSKGKMVLGMNVDTKLDFIPIWIQDKISQDFGEQFFANIVKLSKKYKGSKWQKNTNANPEIFQFFKNAIDNQLKILQSGKPFNKNQKSNTIESSKQTYQPSSAFHTVI